VSGVIIGVEKNERPIKMTTRQRKIPKRVAKELQNLRKEERKMDSF
jgi:hypothetical protein